MNFAPDSLAELDAINDLIDKPIPEPIIAAVPAPKPESFYVNKPQRNTTDTSLNIRIPKELAERFRVALKGKATARHGLMVALSDFLTKYEGTGATIPAKVDVVTKNKGANQRPVKLLAIALDTLDKLRGLPAHVQIPDLNIMLTHLLANREDARALGASDGLNFKAYQNAIAVARTRIACGVTNSRVNGESHSDALVRLSNGIYQPK